MVTAIAELARCETKAQTASEDECGQPITAVPSLEATIAKIAREAVCGPALAGATYNWIAELTVRARTSPDGTTVVTVDEMAKPTYKVYATIAPHGLARPKTGSAWNMATLRLTKPGEGEAGLLHDHRDNACLHQVMHGVIRP